MRENLAWPFSELQHICYVVDDLTKARRFFAPLGIELQEYAYRDRGGFLELEGLRLDGDPDHEEAFMDLGYTHAMMGKVHLQVMAPGRHDTVYRRFIQDRGAGVYSMGFVVDDVDRAEQHLVGKGLPIAWRGRHETGLGFTFFATADVLGVNLSIRQNPRG